MEKDHHHEQLLEGISNQFDRILKNSDQGIYVYLDDTHKRCNSKFASLLGYESTEEWEKVEKSFPEAFVQPDSRSMIISAYQDAMEKMTGSTIDIAWKKKNGGMVDTTVLMVPMAYKDHLFALHFVSGKKNKDHMSAEKEFAKSMLSGD